MRAPRARRPVAAPRAPRPATRSRPASRVGRCRSTCGCRSSRASRTGSGSSSRSSTWAGSPSCSRTAARSAWTSWSTAGAVRKGEPVKVLGNGDLGGVKLEVTAHAFSRSAKEKIAAAGGSAHRAHRSHRRLGGRAHDRPATGLLESSQTCGVRTWRTVIRSSRVSASPARRRIRALRLRVRFRTPDLRKKLLFTLAIIAVYRLGATCRRPACRPPTSTAASSQVSNGAARDVYTLLNLFSGGALLQLSVFALGIMPYITASIILQLLVVVIPRLEQLKKEGQSGQAKITQYTRYLTIGPGDPAVLRRSSRWPAPASCSRAATMPGHPRRSEHLADAGHHGHHDDRRHRRHHVAGRADHRPRRRQRHVGPDLHLDRGPAPGRGLADPADPGQRSSSP